MYQMGIILRLLRNIYGLPFVANPAEPYKPRIGRLLTASVA
jgi:hypothetical protein